MISILRVHERPVLALAYGAAALAAAVGFAQLVRTVYGSHHPAVGLVLAMPALLECGLVAAGLVLIGHAAPMRQGASHHCAQCGYQRVEEIHRLLVNCPECGHAWRRFGGWRVGRSVGSRPKFVLGLIICLAGLSGFALRGIASAWIAARMPTPMLLRHAVYAPAADTQHSWRALGARRLSLAQVRWAAQTLLDRRLATSVLDPAAAGWLGARLTDNSLDADLVDRYFDELVGLSLEAPERVFAGEAVGAAVYALPRVPRSGTPLGEVSLIVGGIEITPPGPPAEDNRTDFEKQFLSQPATSAPQGRGNTLLHAARLQPNVRVAEASAVAPFPGKASATCTVWVLVGPSPGEAVRWSAEGVPSSVMGAKRVIRRTLKAEIEVLPVGQAAPGGP
jgi:DNA-directed RNA polymerase subunit RPC12/RpoP